MLNKIGNVSYNRQCNTLSIQLYGVKVTGQYKFDIFCKVNFPIPIYFFWILKQSVQIQIHVPELNYEFQEKGH